MITYIKRGLMLAAATLSLVAVTAQGVGAQTNTSNGLANGFRVSPVRSELTIEKGKSQTLTVTVENPTNVSTTAKAIVNDFVASDDESGTPRLILDDSSELPKNDFKSLVAELPDIELGAQQKKDISVKISVPESASSGGYYGAIRFAALNGSELKQTNVGLAASVGTIVLVTVPGNLTEKMNLVQMSAQQNGKAKSFLTSGDVGIVTRLKNDGDIHLQPFGKVEVKNMFGKVVSTYEFNNTDPRANILPGSTRRFDNDLAKQKWFGRYTVSANLAYSQGSGSFVSAKSSFWYVPTWALIVLVVSLAALAGAAFLAVKKRKSGSSHKRK